MKFFFSVAESVMIAHLLLSQLLFLLMQMDSLNEKMVNLPTKEVAFLESGLEVEY